MAKVQDFKISLKNISLIKVSFNREITFDSIDQSLLNQYVSIDITNSDLSIDTFVVYLDVEFTFKHKETTIIDAKVTYGATFEKSGEASLESIDSFVNVNAPAIIFPFIREEIASLTGKSSLGALLIQPVNFIQMYENKKNGKTIVL
jgi:preprotein translocase subunit SecB